MAKRSRSSSPPHVAVKSERVAAFVFRRDFRLVDNTALLLLRKLAASRSLRILPVFFFNPVQCTPEKNPYFGKACFEFLCRSLRHLNEVQLGGRLLCLRGADGNCLDTVRRAGYEINCLGFNRDFTPFARERDAWLEEWCRSNGVDCVAADTDYTLLPLNAVVSGSGNPYRVFTPFYRRVLDDYFDDIPKPDPTVVVVKDWFIDANIRSRVETAAFPKKGHRVAEFVDLGTLLSSFPQLEDKGGRDEGLARVACMERAIHYPEERDNIADDRTTHLSPHLKFGTVSIREAMDACVRYLGKKHMLTRQLIWREFYAMILFHNPRLVQRQLPSAPAANEPFDAKYVAFLWKWDDNDFEAFKAGRTGFPIVDAAVRCLTQTGWCHNRCRMIIANFLVKVLFVDWREGERWYASVAVDYDVANNSGGWLWSSGQGADAQPYFRTFNPFRQSLHHDSDAVFIKKWVPELRDVTVKTIHEWDVHCDRYRRPGTREKKEQRSQKGQHTLTGEKVSEGSSYPSPIVNQKERTKWVIERFKGYTAH